MIDKRRKRGFPGIATTSQSAYLSLTKGADSMFYILFPQQTHLSEIKELQIAIIVAARRTNKAAYIQSHSCARTRTRTRTHRVRHRKQMDRHLSRQTDRQTPTHTYEPYIIHTGKQIHKQTNIPRSQKSLFRVIRWESDSPAILSGIAILGANRSGGFGRLSWVPQYYRSISTSCGKLEGEGDVFNSKALAAEDLFLHSLRNKSQYAHGKQQHASYQRAKEMLVPSLL